MNYLYHVFELGYTDKTSRASRMFRVEDIYFLCRMIINERARLKPTHANNYILLFGKIIIQIWIFAGDSKCVRSIVMRISSKRETNRNITGN